VKEEIMRKIFEYFELNYNKNTTYQSLWDGANLMLASNVDVKEEYRFKINDLNFHMASGKEWQIKLKVEER
jgi:hypothetical protein